jgi:hypothetical protein
LKARLAYPPATHTAPTPKAVNKFDLDRFFALPLPWRVTVLKRLGGTGHETRQVLEAVLGNCSQTEIPIEANYGSCDGYLRQLAGDLCQLSARLRCVPAATLGLLADDDMTLWRKAKRLAAAEGRRDAALRAKGGEGLHPSLLDPKVIQRRLKRATSKALQHVSGVLQLIGGSPEGLAPNYVEDLALQRWQDAKSKTDAWMQRHGIAFPAGEYVSLAKIAHSEDVARRSMLYSIALGLQERARRDGLVAIFISASLPSEWHPNPTSGISQHDPRLSPLAAARELQNRWHNSSSMWRGKRCMPYGIRTIEPHADGTPHLHSMLWVSQEDLEGVLAALAKQWPSMTSEEQTARDRGDFTNGPSLVIRRWDEQGEASAITYIMNDVFSALPIDDDIETMDDEAQRTKAWSSALGVRRISFVGLATGTIGRWQAAYRTMRENTAQCPRARAISHAMRRRQWATALVLLGVVPTPSAVPLIRAERGRRAMLAKARQKINRASTTAHDRIIAEQEIIRLTTMGSFTPTPRILSAYRECRTRTGESKRVLAGYCHGRTGRHCLSLAKKPWSVIKRLIDKDFSFTVSDPRRRRVFYPDGVLPTARAFRQPPADPPKSNQSAYLRSSTAKPILLT